MAIAARPHHIEHEQTTDAAPVSLKKNFSWTLLGNLVFVLTQWGTLLVIARLGSPELVGQYAWGLAITAPLMTLCSLSLRDVQITDTHDEFSFAEYAALRIIWNLLGLVALYILLQWVIPGSVPVVLTLIVGATKAIAAVSDIIYGRFQKHERMQAIANSMMIRGVATLAIFAIVMVLGFSLDMAALSAAGVTLVALFAIDWQMHNRAYGDAQGSRTSDIRWRKLYPLTRVSLPLGLAAALTSLEPNVIRYILGGTAGDAALGTFAVLVYPLAAGNLVISALSNVTLPRLTSQLGRGELSAFWSLLLRLCGLGAALGLATVIVAHVFGRFFLDIVFGPEYAAHADVFTLLVLGMAIGFVNWFLNAGLTATKMFRQALHFQLIALILTLLLSYIMIREWGLTGAALVDGIVMNVGAMIKGTALWLRKGQLERGEVSLDLTAGGAV